MNIKKIVPAILLAFTISSPLTFSQNDNQLITVYPIIKLYDYFRLDLANSQSDKYNFVNVTDQISEQVKTPGYQYFVVERK